jgi:hypothetical protein
MLDFHFFRTSDVACAFASRLTRVNLGDCDDWDHYRSQALARRSSFGGEFNDGFVQSIQDAFGSASSGEKCLIIAILHAIDYDRLAEDLCSECGRSFFDLLTVTDVDTRALVACCVLRLNSVEAGASLDGLLSGRRSNS